LLLVHTRIYITSFAFFITIFVLTDDQMDARPVGRRPLRFDQPQQLSQIQVERQRLFRKRLALDQPPPDDVTGVQILRGGVSLLLRLRRRRDLVLGVFGTFIFGSNTGGHAQIRVFGEPPLEEILLGEERALGGGGRLHLVGRVEVDVLLEDVGQGGVGAQVEQRPVVGLLEGRVHRQVRLGQLHALVQGLVGLDAHGNLLVLEEQLQGEAAHETRNAVALQVDHFAEDVGEARLVGGVAQTTLRQELHADLFELRVSLRL
jgi:hypothetical protein